MGLFDAFKKKDCEICGKEVGLFGYKKLENGEICKDCVKLLSPWFDDRRHSTVAQIKQQLTYREENRAALNSFRPTLAFGERFTLRAELVNGVPSRFVVERTDSYKEENADIISFRDVTSFNIDVQESNRELTYRNSKGEEVSYNPPRYEYSYDFYAEIHVNHPYFDDIKFQLNRDSIDLETVERRPGLGATRTGFDRNGFDREAMDRRSGFNTARTSFDPTLYPEYRQFRAVCDELEELFRAGMQGIALKGFAPAVQPVVQAAPVPQPTPDPAPAPTGPKFCPNCGAPAAGGKFCQSCGSRL